uniref:Myb/SANT-like domain-containing protein n=1 Tax=Chenopodium quinoa TaxID=63459 RepID=A0A803LM94_CHEQI
MSTKRASFTSDIVTILLGILPDHVTPAGGKVDWDNVANILNQRTGKTFSAVSVKNWFSNMKEKHKAWRELKRWTGLGWGPNNCPLVDLESERWLAFSKKYKANGRSLLRTPFENEQEWNNIFKGGYASGDETQTPNISIQPPVARSDPKKRKSIDSQPSRISGKKSREEDIDACLDVLRRSSLSQSSKPKNAFDEVLSILDS